MKLFKKMATVPDLLKQDKADDQADFTGIQTQFQDGLFKVMEKVYSEREDDSINSDLGRDDVDAIVAGYVKKNMLITAAASVVPGPLGVFSALPEIIMVMSNQMRMVYDLGCAYDKEAFFNKDVLVDIPLMAFGGQSNLGQLQDLDNLEDSPEELLREKSLELGKTIIEKNLKKSMTRWVPVAGPVLMSIWTKGTTKMIATKSIDFFDPKKILVDGPEQVVDNKLIEFEKLKALINLIEADETISEEQLDFILPVIRHSTLATSRKEMLMSEARQMDSNFEIDATVLLADPTEVDNLLMDMSIMAKRDGHLHQKEIDYIFHLAKQLNVDASFVEELLA